MCFFLNQWLCMYPFFLRDINGDIFFFSCFIVFDIWTSINSTEKYKEIFSFIKMENGVMKNENSFEIWYCQMALHMCTIFFFSTHKYFHILFYNHKLTIIRNSDEKGITRHCSTTKCKWCYSQIGTLYRLTSKTHQVRIDSRNLRTTI